MEGKFITFEGVEGSGKSTQARALHAKLLSMSVKCILTREPGGGKEADAIRQILLDANNNLTPETELLLFYAARTQHITKVIKPALEAGNVVICDRFTDSTFAYQIYGRGIPEGFVYSLHNLLLGNFKPDITLLMDIEPEKCASRLAKRDESPDRIEKMPIDFHNRVRHGFLQLTKKEPERFITYDANMDEVTIAHQVFKSLQEYGFVK